MPTCYVDQDGVMYNHQQIECYEYRKRETIKQWERVEPQSNLDSSESGQKYEIIGNTPFAAVKPEKMWKIVLGNMIATPYEFESKEAAEEYVKEKPWELLWTMAVWVVNNQEKFKFVKGGSKSWE